ncbi:unnamed protein product, partial [Ectocarpus fasciculatus]
MEHGPHLWRSHQLSCTSSLLENSLQPAKPACVFGCFELCLLFLHFGRYSCRHFTNIGNNSIPLGCFHIWCQGGTAVPLSRFLHQIGGGEGQ